jgi:hypothetical protein
VEIVIYITGVSDRRGVAWSEQSETESAGTVNLRSLRESLDEAAAGLGRGYWKERFRKTQYLALPRLTPRVIRLRSRHSDRFTRSVCVCRRCVGNEKEMPSVADVDVSHSSAEEQSHLRAVIGSPMRQSDGKLEEIERPEDLWVSSPISNN